MEDSEEKTREQATIFAALADPTRLSLVKLLCRQHDPDALCVNALAYYLGVTQSAISQHLRVLRGLGLVRGQRRGYRVHYFVDRNTLERCKTLVSEALSIDVPSKKDI